MKKTWLAAALSLTLLVPTLAACTKNKSPDTQGERVLRIATSMGYGDDEYFRQQFTELFEFANPNVKIEFIPTRDERFMYGPAPEGEKPKDPMDTLKEVMQGANPPDVIMFGLEQLPELLDENLLTPLDPMIAKDKFDLSDVVPAVMDGLKSASTDGKLYALSPTFSSSALIYNKKMFDDAGVPYPTDNMTWDQLFDLARRLSKGEGSDRVYGFNFQPHAGSDLFNAIGIYTAPLQLKMFDDKGEKMTVDTDQWEKVWTTLIQLQKDNVIPNAQQMEERMMRMQERENSPFGYDDFMSGRLAMTVQYYGSLSQIDNANKSAESIKGYNRIDYDVVTLPSHSEAPGLVPSVGLNGIMGINTKAQNVEDAWKYLKFINGEEWAKLKSHSNYQLVSRKKYIKPKDGSNFHIEAFYNIKPVPEQNEFYKLYREKPNIHMVQQVGRQEMQQAIEGKKSIRDALKAWQTQGDAMLLQMKENPNAPLDQFMPQGKAAIMRGG